MSSPAGAATVRQHNRALVLGRVAAVPGRTRAQVAAETGLARATVSTLVDELLEARLLIERAPAPGLRGRPGSPLALNPAGPAAVGIEINVDQTSACVLDFTGVVRVRRTIAVDNAAGAPRAGLRRAARLAKEVAASVDCPIAGVALALPGLVTPAGVVREMPNLPRWTGAEVHDLLSGSIGAAPVVVDNEANLAALAEQWYGSARGDFLYVSGEVGVGGGLVLGGELFRGVRGFAGELGHVLVDPRGPECACGNRGCLEQFAGSVAMRRAARVADDEELVERAERGEGRALGALHKAAVALGVALAAAVNVVDVPTVVLGGFYARLGGWLAEPLSAELRRRVISRSPVEVCASTLGTDAAMLGAAGTVVQRIIASAAVPTIRPALP